MQPVSLSWKSVVLSEKREGVQLYHAIEAEVKSLHNLSDSTHAFVGVEPDGTDDCLDKVGSKLG